MVAGLAAMVGCHSKPSGSASATATKQYPVRGTVMGVDTKGNDVSFTNEDIPGFMTPMTMNYAVTDPAALSELHPGDKIAATLLVDEDAAGAENLRLKDIVVVGEANINIKPTVQYHLPAAGDEVPSFKLLNQSGRAIDLKQYRGKVVALTFIYTRCPLADYCPRMSHNFAQIDKALAADPALYAKTHLLSVSFDPTYDTPKVLKSYGEAYTGRYVKETFQHWEFAVPPAAELPKVEQWFDVGVTPGENGTLQHSLSTVVIGRDGKVVAFWPTNDWSPAEVLAKIKAAAA
ncbi:redoxin domain-containing protein [Granulicella sp. 5B5]|nr:redoxin domain-containing protein [Granulicella sp. 5B5]